MIATLGAVAMQNLDIFLYPFYTKNRKIKICPRLIAIIKNGKYFSKDIYYYRQIISINHLQTPIARVIDRNAQ